MISKRTRHQVNPKKIFLISGISAEKRQEYAKMIRFLGGIYIDTESFKSTCTHIVCGKLTRSEKFLGGCATGKWILKANYIEDSFKYKQWLEEERYEWTQDDTNKDDLKEIASAPRRWRESFLLNHSSFSGFKVALLVEGNKRTTVYKRLLTCGGATIFNIQLPITKPEKISSAIQYIFADRSLAAKHLPASLLDYGILCLSPDYIGDFLIKEKSPDLCDYLVIGPCSIFSSLSKECEGVTDSICSSQSSNCSGNLLKTISVDNMSTMSTHSNKSISPIKPQKLKVKLKQNTSIPTKSRKSKGIPSTTPSDQRQLYQFGFSSVKKMKAESSPLTSNISIFEMSGLQPNPIVKDEPFDSPFQASERIRLTNIL